MVPWLLSMIRDLYFFPLFLHACTCNRPFASLCSSSWYVACLKLCFLIVFYALTYGQFADKVYCGQQGVQTCSPGTLLMQASLTLFTEANYHRTCLTFIFVAYPYRNSCEQLMSFIMLAKDNGWSSDSFFFSCLFGICPFPPTFSLVASFVDVAPEGFLSLAIYNWRTTKIKILTLCKKANSV